MNTKLTDEKIELLPCPFCGNDAPRMSYRMDESIYSHATVQYLRVTCDECGCESVDSETHSEVIAAWNSRAAIEAEVLSGASGAEGAGPVVPEAVIQAITRYGDSRADFENDGGMALASCVRVIRQFAASPAAPVPPADAVTMLRRACENALEAGNDGDWQSARKELRAALDATTQPPADGGMGPIAYGAREFTARKAGAAARWVFIANTEQEVRDWINLQHNSRDDVTYAGPFSLRSAAALPPAGEPVAPAPSSSLCDAAYDQIDRFLRNNLSDEDYADYSQALDLLSGISGATESAGKGGEVGNG